MIEVAGLRKEYGGFVAVEDLSLSVDPGEVFGLVGPNGAGKTTTLKMIAGLVEPTAGSATVAGFDADDPEMRRHLGFLPEESPLYEEMTAVSYLSFFADLYDVPRATARERIERALDRLDLEHRRRKIGDMSKGMKRKVAIARALVNDPDVLVFDEPASGLDPRTTNYINEFVGELAERDKTVVFSAHNLYHVEDVCDRVAILNEGSVVGRGSLESIREEHGDTAYHVYLTVPVENSIKENGRHVRIVEDYDEVDAVREAAVAAGGRVVDVRTVGASLEEIFLELAGTSRDDEPPGASVRRDRGPGTPGSDVERTSPGVDGPGSAVDVADSDAGLAGSDGDGSGAGVDGSGASVDETGSGDTDAVAAGDGDADGNTTGADDSDAGEPDAGEVSES